MVGRVRIRVKKHNVCDVGRLLVLLHVDQLDEVLGRAEHSGNLGLLQAVVDSCRAHRVVKADC